jgi:hypothetical protein
MLFLCQVAEASSAKPELLAALATAFPFSLFLRRRLLLLGVAVLATSALVWTALDLRPPLHEDGLQPLILFLWLGGTVLGFALGRLIRGTGWLVGIGVDDR